MLLKRKASFEFPSFKLKTRSTLGGLPEAELVAIGIAEERQKASDFLFRGGGFDTLGSEVADCSLNISNTEA